MLNVLFWNMKRKDLGAALADVAKDTAAGIVVVAEADPQRDSESTAEHLRTRADERFVASEPENERFSRRFQMFCRDVSVGFEYVYDADRVHIRRIWLENTAFLLAFVHAVDPRNYGLDARRREAESLVDQIRLQESLNGHDRTFAIGDFNMNPFELGMVDELGFNAKMTVRCAETGRRGQSNDVPNSFYNPMWGLFGDRTKGAPGTFFHESRTSGFHGWNMLDQVLVRPSAVPWFRDVDILERAGDVELTTKTGRPRRNQYSDHLPILLTIGETS